MRRFFPSFGWPATLLVVCGALRATSIAQSVSTSLPAGLPPTLSVRADLVEIPAFVTAKSGKIAVGLRAEDFFLTDNKIRQQLTLIPDIDSRPLALAVVVETGGVGAAHLGDYAHLDRLLKSLVGDAPHQVALIAFDSAPELIVPFTADVEVVSSQVALLRPGNTHAALLDAVTSAARLLSKVPSGYRRAVLILSETIDRDSLTPVTNVIRLLSDTNTRIYAFGFASAGFDVEHEASKFNRSEPGPVKGCFSHDHTGDPSDDEYNGHYSRQVLDCISEVAPPLRLVTMAWLASRDGLQQRTESMLADLTGGVFYNFHESSDFDAAILRASNDVRNFYILSFHPSNPTPGLHNLQLRIPARPKLRLRARSTYWIDSSP